MKKSLWLEAAWVWLALAAFGVVNGAFRRTVLDWILDGTAARFVSTTTLAGAVLLAALLWIGTRPRTPRARSLVLVGLGWAIATVAFDAGLAALAGDWSWSRALAEYDLPRGGYFGLVVLAELIGPWAVGWMRRAGPVHRRAH